MPIPYEEFKKWPIIPKEIRRLKLAWEVYETLSRRPSSAVDLVRLLNRPKDEIVSMLNQLMRIGFIGFRLSDTDEARFYWAQTTNGRPALKNR